MHYTSQNILALSRIQRLNTINSISGIKPANLIGTISSEDQSNVAIFSSVVHLGSNPPLLGFILRPQKEVRRHTYENILENGCYTINHITKPIIQQAHYTSAKFNKEESEFKACSLTEEYLFDFKAPFVKECQIKMAMTLKEAIPIKVNDTIFVIGEIQHLLIPDEIIHAEGHLDLGKAEIVGISGLNSYYELNKVAQLPYARVHELPDFNFNS